MKKIVVAPDSFKGSMTSGEICNIVEGVVKEEAPQIAVVKVPIADGGEGTVDAFLTSAGGKKVFVEVTGPCFERTRAFYGILPDEKTAVIEMAAASGLPLVRGKKDPSVTTTYGTGELIKNALERGCSRIIVGIGGSATNDGGIGMAAALGVKFLDERGNDVELTGRGLERLHKIDTRGLDPRLKEAEVIVACDVDNPLHGPEGAAYVYAPQKGADEEMVRYLDSNLKHYSDVLKNHLDFDAQSVKGAGAAGGLGAGLVAFAGGKLKPGIDVILEMVRFEEIISDADLIITGEGRIDGQSLRGKAPVGVAKRAAKKGIPVLALAGDVDDSAEKLYEYGITSILSINRSIAPLDIAIARSQDSLKHTVRAVIRLLANPTQNRIPLLKRNYHG
ncbi:MAG: glycerate kinase [Firmicutes bacterium]|nr:glycerate kinase [Bacillota bacterium]